MNRACRWGLGIALVAAAFAGVSAAMQPQAPSRELLRMHDDFVLAFVDSAGFGRMRITPMMRTMQRYRTRGERALWVERVELIGIAKHDPPVVFASPFMGFQHVEGDKAASPRGDRGRPPTPDERAALRALARGERLVVRGQGDGLRAIGAIRAADECLGCHRKARAGDMLGALIYTLRPAPRDASSDDAPAARPVRNKTD